MLIVRLPFPDPALMPNRKNGKHWSSTHAVKVASKTQAWACTKDAMRKAGPQEWKECIPLSLIFVMPDNRHRDLDNLLASSKNAIDGMAEALGVNDRRFKPIMIDSIAGHKNPALIAVVGVRIQSLVSLETA